MNCKYIKKKINKQVWCTKYNKPCTNCNNKEYNMTRWHVSKKISQKSKKLSKLEKNRFSILTDDLNHCIICGKKKDNLHEMFFGKDRVNSMKFNLIIPLCFSCHQEMHKNIEWQEYWHRQGQLMFEKKYPDLEFLDIFKRNYL